MKDDATVLARAALVIASSPALWRSLLAAHIAGRDGRCVACWSPVHGAPRWPCRINAVAVAARAEHERTHIPPRESLN